MRVYIYMHIIHICIFICISVFFSLKHNESHDAACWNSSLYEAKSVPMRDEKCCTFIAWHRARNSLSTVLSRSEGELRRKRMNSTARALLIAGGYSFKYPVQNVPSTFFPMAERFGSDPVR